MATHIKVTDTRFGDDLACGQCFSLINSDEVYCPCCGEAIEDRSTELTEDELCEAHTKYWGE